MLRATLLFSVLMLSHGVAHPHINTFIINHQTYRAIQADPKNVGLHWQDSDGNPYSSIGNLKAALIDKGKTVVALMNAGIYSANDKPAGLHIAAGNTLKSLNTKPGKGNFHLQPNGVFLIDKRHTARILTTQQYLKDYQDSNKTDTIRLATQSGPMLVINGNINPNFIPSSNSKYTRNGVCTSDKGELFFFATEGFPKTKSNLYDFAQAALHLGCNNALYLDGSISKLYINGEDSTLHFGHFVGMLSLTE